MKKLAYILLFTLVQLLSVHSASGTICLRDGQLYNTDEGSVIPYNAVSMWYAPLLGGSKDALVRKRLVAELDSLQQIGVNVIEVLAGAQAELVETKDSLQNAKGTVSTLASDKACFRGMDFLLNELKQRKMWAVVNLDRLPCFVLQRQQTYLHFIEKWLLHKNVLTNEQYKDDANILAWKVCDELPIGSDSLSIYTDWTKACVKRIKQIDKEHLVMAVYTPLDCSAEDDAKSLSFFMSETEADCVEIAISPYAQGWVGKGSIIDGLPHLFLKLDERIEAYNRALYAVERPYVVSVQYPRDAHFTRPGTSSSARDTFYEYIGLKVNECRSNENALVGCAIRGWGGSAKPNSLGVWSNAAEFTSEYLDEKKGEYAVFNADKQTIKLLTKQFKQK